MDAGLNVEWECPSCTLINTGASYRCQCCGTSKGTSTRQTKLYYAALEQQYAAESLHTSHKLQASKGLLKSPMLQTHADSSGTSSGSGSSNTGTVTGRGRRRVKSPSVSAPTGSNTNAKLKTTARIYKQHMQWPRLKDIDRSSAKSYRITVDSVTVIITEYQHLNADPE